MKKKISLKWKIAEYLGLFAIGLIALLVVFQQLLLEPMYEKFKIDQVHAASDEVIAALDSSDSELAEVVASVSARNDTCVRIKDSSGMDGLTGNMGCLLYRMNTRELIEQYDLAKENGNEYLSVTTGGIGMAGGIGSGPGGNQPPNDLNNDDVMKNLTLTRIVENDDGYVMVMVYSGLTPVNATTQTLKYQIFYIALIIILAMALLIFLMNRKIALPLMNINEAAKQLPQGVYEVNEKTNQYREAQELNETLTEAATDIQKADKAKRDLIANVSHDLRTPLTMIKGYGEMMRDLPGEKTDENLQVIIDESDRLKYLVNDLLDLSKLEDNRIVLSCSDFSLSDLVERNVKKYQYYHVQEGFEIETGIAKDIIVNGDETRIEQVFNNFMSNAVNYSGDSKKIIVRLIDEGAKAKVEVQDFGEGIEKDKLKDIWDRYYKIDKTHVRRTDSSGIGLNICRQILELHKLNYGVESEPGKGSTFWFEMDRKS